MNTAIVGQTWWNRALEINGHTLHPLPAPVQPPANPYSADLAARTRAGQQWAKSFDALPFDWILDNGAAGLAFLPDPANHDSLKLVHESLGLPLASHWIDPMVTLFQSLPWGTVWQSLQSNTWFKFVWDRTQTEELVRFGIPNVFQLPMAAPDRQYDTSPLDAASMRNMVSFVGGQNTSYFYPGRNVPAQNLWAGTLAMGVRSDMPDVNFPSIYYDLFQLAEPPNANDDLPLRAKKAYEYYSAKLFYNACGCIRQRDRFVIFLKKKLGDMFTLIGDHWDTAYGLPCQPQLPTTDEYLNHFRQTAININLVNGNSDSGLNMRHFEITAAGGFMLCYHAPELDQFFQVSRECESFQSEQELLEKIEFFLAHPEKRIEIALAGQQRTLREHLYSHRINQLVDSIVAADKRSISTIPNQAQLAAT